MEDRKKDATQRLFELLYHELRRIAQHHLANKCADYFLQATDLVHEASTRLVAGGHTIQKIAKVMGVSVDTVKTDWCVERAWLYGELTNGLSQW
jgi:DNA-directed RNA polymerase specialized sigma24 family protein